MATPLLSSLLVLVLCLLSGACESDDPPSAAPDASDSEVPSASKFCDAYEAACGFGKANTFSDREDCEDDFGEKLSDDRKQCAAEHLTLAEDDPDAHCEAAKGDEVCR